MEFKIDLNTYKSIKELEDCRKEVNEAIDKRMASLITSSKANEISNKSFGYIKEAFENIAPSLFNSTDGRNIIKRYTEAIKANKALGTMHALYESVRKTGKNSDVNFFLDEITSDNINVDTREFNEGRKILGNILAEGYILVNDETLLPKENTALDGAIEFIAENKKGVKNLHNYSSAVKIVREAVESHDSVDNIFESKNIDDIANELLREYNEKYNDQLSEEEKALVKELAESKAPEEVFNKYKSACESKLAEAKEGFVKSGDSTSAKKIESIMEQVSKKSYSAETIGEDICNLVEISNIFD